MSLSSQLLTHGPSAALAWHSRVQHAGLWLAGDLLHPAAQGVLKGMPHLPDPQIPAGQRRGRHSTNRGRRCYSLRRFVVRHIETRGENFTAQGNEVASAAEGHGTEPQHALR